MADQLPVRYQQLLDLTQLGVAPAAIGFTTLTLQSDKYITVREEGMVTIIDTANPTQPQKRPINADNAIMHPTHSILALRAKNVLQVFKLAGSSAEKVASYDRLTEAIEYWRWISPTILGIVTPSSVYHWNVEGGAAPTLVFQRIPNLAGHQIISYQVNHDLTWVCLIGIAQQNNRIVGHGQLFSTEKGVSQPIDAHAAAFGTRQVPGQAKPVTTFAFVSRNTLAPGQLFIIDVGTTTPGNKITQSIFFPDSNPNDFPLSIEISGRFSVVYLLTKEGYFHLCDLESGKRIIVNQVSNDALFIAAPHAPSSGIMAINKRGQVFAVTVNENNIIPFIMKNLNDTPLAVSLSSRGNLPGADALFQMQFQQLIQGGNYAGAAKIAAESPRGILRTAGTISLLKTLPAVGGAPPLLTYFGILLEKGKLNEQETNELVGATLQQGRKELVDTWLKEDKLHCSEALGDVLRQIDPRAGLLVYDRAKAHHKVVAMLAETGQYDAMVTYAKKENYTPNWMQLLQAVIARNAPAAAAFAKMLLTAEGGALMDTNAAIDAFMARGHVKEVTSLLLDVLSGNKPEDGPLQTRLLEINLKHAPRVADAIFTNKMFSHYDRAKIAPLCEAAGLHMRALELYDNLTDVKRLLAQAQGLTPEFLVGFFGRFSLKDTLDLLRELLKTNLAQNLEGVVAVGARYTPAPQETPDPENLQPQMLIKIFEEFNTYQGTYLYLKQVVPLFKTSKDVVFKYIEAAAKVGATQDVEAAVRAYEYDPIAVRELLKEVKLSDQLSLVIVCDKHGYVEDLTHYMFRNNMLNFIELYLQNINPLNTPIVIGALLDENADENKIKQIINAVGHLCPVDKLVEEVEKRNRLKLLRPWLEARFNEGNREAATHNAMAKILIITNDERKEQFLQTNPYYESAVVGKFCEQSEPELAVQAYKRGGLHLEVIGVTNKHSMFKQQARYLVEQQNPELWAHVLQETNEYRRQLIDEVVQTVLPETKKAEQVSVAVKAFMDADLPNELIELLERIVLESHNPEFAKNRNLQNLLIFTSITSNKEKTMDFVTRLNEYDANLVADRAIDNGLFEEAFAVHKKFKHNVEAITVLLDNLNKIDRALEFAERVNEPQVWSKLGRAQLQAGLVKESIDSFLKSEDPESYFQVIQGAKDAGLFEPLVKFLKMARKLKKEKIDTELAYALASINRLAELEEFISQPNQAKIQEVGESCFQKGLFEAAKICFNSVNNYARLASTLVQLKQFGPAVEAARKASNIVTWKEVNKACVDAGEIRLAQVCGLNIIVNGEELDEIVQHYEVRGKTDELMALIESGLGLERAHQGMFTTLAQLYSNYKPEKLMEHLKLFITRINIGKVCNTCRDNQQWSALAYLFSHDNEYDKAVKVMMEHSVDAWDDVQFKDHILKVKNTDLFYDAVKFYLDEHPQLVNELLLVMKERVDPAKVVDRVRRLQKLPLIKPFLVAVQEKNIAQVNEALHELYIEEEDYESLKTSIDTYDNFEAIALAQQLEKNELLEFRRIAAHLYKVNKRWKQSIDLSKKDKLYKDAMATVAASKEKALAEELLAFFIEIESPHSFGAALFTCYDLISPDVALELAWKNKMTDFVMPYMIQVLREYTGKIDSLVAANKAHEAQVYPHPHPHPGMPPPPPGYMMPPPPYAGPPVPVPPPGAVPVPGPVPPPYPGVPAPQAPPPPRPGFDPNDFSAFGM